MRSLSCWMSFVVLCGGLALPCKTTTATAAEEEPGAQAQRLDRLERRVNELAQRQERLMQRLESVLQREDQMPREGREGLRRSTPVPDREGLRGPGPLPGAERVRGPRALRAHMAPVAAKAMHDIHGLLKLCILGAIIFNILLAIWIFTDIRKRGEGSGIFIALALVAGIPAAVIYTLVRIGDKKA